MITQEQMITFEREIKDMYLEGKIRALIHIAEGNESQLIEIFKSVNNQNWVFSTHRNHYHALLKEVDKEWPV